MLIQDVEWGEVQRGKVPIVDSPPFLQPQASPPPQSPPQFDSISRHLDVEQVRHDLLIEHESASISPARQIYLAVPAAQQTLNISSRNDIWIHIQDAVHVTKFTRLPEFFWTCYADSSCMVCGRPFDPEVEGPIRTLSLEPRELHARPPDILPTVALSIRVHNRHLSCIRQSSTSFVSISHVWGSAVAEAHLQGPHTSPIPAAKELFEVISMILPAISANFSTATHQAEIWHDYFSVPQWNRQTQQQLLAMLPDIFQVADATIIYLHDISADLVLSIAQNSSYSPEKKYENLVAFYSSVWFQRMWVSLEFARCSQACILTKDMRLFAAVGGNGWDSFTWLLQESRQCARSVLLKVGPSIFFSWFKKSQIPIIGRILNQRRGDSVGFNSITYGEALSFVAGRKCREYRDRFVAIGCLLKLNSEHPLHTSLPQHPAEACLWIVQKCFERGDYSPLLVQQVGELPMPNAPWLAGHENMHELMWDLGPLISPPWNAKITMLNERLHLSLECVGSPGSLFVNKPNSPQELFETTLTLTLGNATLRTAEHLVSAMGRVFGVPPIARLPDLPIELRDYLKQDSDFTTSLDCLIAEYLAPYEATSSNPPPSPDHKNSKRGSWNSVLTSLRLLRTPRASTTTSSGKSLTTCTITTGSVRKVEGRSRKISRPKVSNKIMELLKLHQHLGGAYIAYSRFEFASASTNGSTSYSDVMAMIQCPSCKKRHPYRFSLLKGVDHTSLKLFRIPGLGYVSSLIDGVGLVISWNTIVGRFIYGTRTCDCRNMETVVLDTVTKHVQRFHAYTPPPFLPDAWDLWSHTSFQIVWTRSRAQGSMSTPFILLDCDFKGMFMDGLRSGIPDSEASEEIMAWLENHMAEAPLRRELPWIWWVETPGIDSVN